MSEFRIGKLKDDFCITWYDNSDGTRKRRRYRLKAKSINDAWAEGQLVYNTQLQLLGTKLKFEMIYNAYIEYLGDRRTATQLRTSWKKIGPFFGSYDPLMIDDALVDKYLKIRREDFRNLYGREISNSTTFTEINLIQSTLNFAKKKKLISEDPHHLRKPTRPRPVDRWLTRSEIQALLSETRQTPHLHIATVLMLSTAGRIGAVLDLTWDRVDFENRTIDLRVEESAHSKSRAFIPMNEGTASLLSQWKKLGYSDYVVEYRGGRVDSIKNAFSKAVKRAGLPGKVTPHVLRHTSAVHMVASGSSIFKVSQYLGHSSISVTEKVYARFAPGHLRNEAKAVDFLQDQEIELVKAEKFADE